MKRKRGIIFHAYDRKFNFYDEIALVGSPKAFINTIV